MIRKRKTSIPARRISLLAGILTALAVCCPSYLKTPVYAWWGTMYPQYCFSPDTEDTGESVPVKIDFRWLRIK